MIYDPIGCPCEHGGNCRMVRACAVDEMVSDAVYQAELKADDNHAAFVARVREIAEGMEHDESCDAYDYDDFDYDEYGSPAKMFKPKCRPAVCLRGRLLEVCNG